ncbi:tyrosine-type recombinase/integrase [Viridibacillus sp. FSL R5-0468]|uniref:tyrosine-type recombinase/integrase n=1 Tax=Viridibacillus sp. FSL R5-0468 TaxID=2921640 RepID=UPI0030FC6051
MKVVHPIRDKELIEEIIEYMLNKSERDAIMFMMGIYTGLRISDILSLKVKDVQGTDTLLVEPIKTKNSKKKKFKTIEIYIQPEFNSLLQEFVEGKKPNEYIFKSRQGRNKPIVRQRAYDILKEVACEFDIPFIGTHSLRKTFGYHMYQKDKDVAMLQEIFGHHSQHDTLRYIGVSGEAIKKARKELSFMRGRKKLGK